MKCTFVAMGAENISLQVLSALLKQHGHRTALAYDQALFDDKNYLCKPNIAKFFDHRKIVLQQVIDSQPDLVAFSVMTPTYQWALDMASAIKEILDVPVIFGGPHPTLMPDQVICNDSVDIVCVGEGDYALLDLCNALDNGGIDYNIENLWFKKNGSVIQNKQRPLIADLDTLPLPDKTLFENHVPIKNYYLAVTVRGCPYMCTYCELSHFAQEAQKLGGKRLRERSVDSVINEIKIMRERYGFKWVDFRNNTFTATRKWVTEFCDKYKREIGLPFKIFAHPATIDDDIARMLKDAGCFGAQLGVESYDPWVRKHILNRHETNEMIEKTVRAFDKAKLPYSIDYILGLPRQTEDELIEAAQFFITLDQCYRISPFLLMYTPRLEMVQKGLQYGDLTDQDVIDLEAGKHNHYLSTGSVGKDPEKLRFYTGFKLFFRMIPFVPKRFASYLLRTGKYKVLTYLPADFVFSMIDFFMIFRRCDRDAFTYAKNYWYWFFSRFDRSHPAYRKRGVSKR